MPNRMQKAQYELAYSFIAARDGEHCLNCRRGPHAERKKDRVRLQIDHQDKNPANNAPENLHLLCARCNTALRGLMTDDHITMINTYSAKNERVRERDNKTDHAKYNNIRIAADISAGSTETQLNAFYEPRFRDAVFVLIDEIEGEGSLATLKECINSGAEDVGCSVVACRRYMDKLTSRRGPLCRDIGPDGQIIISRKVQK